MNLPERRDDRPVEFRIGHAERDAVVAQLQQAAAEGRLTLEELEERVEAALQARTNTDLAPLTADLPDGRQSLAATGNPGYSPDDPLRVTAGWEGEKREGQWTIPPWIMVDPGFSEVKLDCRQAVAAEPVITIQVNSGAGTVTIVVPQGWGANLDRLNAAWGTKKAKNVPAEPGYGKPLLRFEGSTGMSTVVVRHESWWDKKIKP